MSTLVRYPAGRIILHLLAMLGDRCVRFHAAGIIRELSRAAAAPPWLVRLRSRLVGALVLYLARPIRDYAPGAPADAGSLLAVLERGDVLLTDGITRGAALVKSVTQSPWSHVSMYVGPLEGGPDPRCIVEADIAAGVRSIRLSELNALQVRVLRPIGLTEANRSRLVDWVVGRIGSEYDLMHAWMLGRSLLPLPLPAHLRSWPSTIGNSATRFICCSLLTNAFAVVGYPIPPPATRASLSAPADHRHLTPGDFESARAFEVIYPKRAAAPVKESAVA
jgi:hypothetical protein